MLNIEARLDWRLCREQSPPLTTALALNTTVALHWQSSPVLQLQPLPEGPDPDPDPRPGLLS